MMRLRIGLLMLLLPLSVAGQDVVCGRMWQPPIGAVAFTAGYTMPNKTEWSYIAGATYGVDASLLWNVSGALPWHRAWRMPSFGLRANYAYIPDGIAGDRFGMAAFMVNPLWNPELHPASLLRRTVLSWELDFGLSGYSNPYCRTPDMRNEFIGSYLNCLIHFGLRYDVSVGMGGSGLTFAAKLVHSSNGYLQKPNQGLNFLQGEIGWMLAPKTGEPKNSVEQKNTLDAIVSPIVSNDGSPRDDISRFSLQPHSYLSFSYAPGLVQPRFSGASRRYFYCHTAEAAYLWRPDTRDGYLGRFAYGGGIDLSYNFSMAEQSRWYHDNYGYDLYTLPFNICYFGTFEPYWGPMSVRISLGGYLLKDSNPHVVSLPFYERVGLMYHSACGLFGGISMRAYAAHVDFIEWNIGYQFRLRGALY